MRRTPQQAANPPASRPGRRERRRVETHERLFRAALRTFSKKGYAETSIEDITEAADVGKGTFFNYFPSKEHILMAFGEMQLGKLRAAVAAARESNEPMMKFFRRLSAVMTEEPGRNPAIVRALLMANLSSAPVRQAIRQNIEHGRELMAKLLELGQQRGEVRRDRQPLEIARALHQTVFGTLMMWSLDPATPLQERIESAFSLLWDGIQAREGVPSVRAPFAGI